VFRKNFLTPKMVLSEIFLATGGGGGGGGGRSPKLICSTKTFSGVVGQNPKKSGKFLSAPLIFSFPYTHENCYSYMNTKRDWLTCGHVALDECNVPQQVKNSSPPRLTTYINKQNGGTTDSQVYKLRFSKFVLK
jgi:hypothetical protein